jgi:hypothetical protein
LGDERAYANDRVIDELWKLVAHLRAHFVVGLSDQSGWRRRSRAGREQSRYPGR